MVMICVRVGQSILNADLAYILFVKTSRSVTVSSALSPRVREYCRLRTEEARGADPFLYPPGPSSPWRSQIQLLRPLHPARLYTTAHGSAKRNAPVTEADATRCRTARMTHRLW
jgi:hypothetical protein